MLRGAAFVLTCRHSNGGDNDVGARSHMKPPLEDIGRHSNTITRGGDKEMKPMLERVAGRTRDGRVQVPPT